ncbi:cytochrome P450 [Lojkania enalia]|uniref:Cytochrome P450 n=1 Tax=Lojkania enalia TaxID=147567 RepID=A0A9P4KE23_9PLEO|nr:cytochrome P450 [Didymosphaeria enalia]
MVAQNISHKLIKDQLMAILLGGKDPSAITITWALYELARHPKAMTTLREEISSIVGMSDPPNAAHLKKMTFLHNTIQEILRLHSPLGFNIRTALNDTTLPTGGGPAGDAPIGIPHGTPIIIANASLQRRADLIGPDADEFRPGRWDNEWRPAIWSYLPFNHGPRICLGKNFAMMQMEYIICRLLQAFSTIEIVMIGDCIGDGDVRTKIALNTKPAEPIWLRFAE